MADISPTAEGVEGGGEDASKEAETDKEIHQEAMERFKQAEEAWDHNRKSALEAVKFRNLEQWPDKIKKEREAAGRPCLVVDKSNQYVRQVVNDGRQNRPGVKVRPEDDGHEEVAEAFQDIIRSICNRSNADAAFDTALDHAATGGFGWIRVATQYVHEKTFEQDIVVKRVRNNQAVLLDPNIQEADGSDAGWGFVLDEMPKKEFKKRWPKAKVVDFERDGTKYSDGWITGDNVRYAEYFYKVEEPGQLHLLEDGSSIPDSDYQRALKELGPEKVPAILETREVPITKVKWCRLSGAEILEKNDWLGKYIPIIPVFGNELDVDGKVYYSGLIRGAMDPLRLYNYMRSHFAENVALASKAPYVAAVGQTEGRPEWDSLNTEPVSVALYNPIDVDGNVLPPPRRESPPAIPEAYARDMQLSEHDIQASMGMYSASLGEKSNEKSGKAIMARQREGDTGTFHYPDNLNRGICYLGRQLVDLVPKIIDSRRVVQMMGEDGSARKAMVDPQQQEPVRKEGKMSIYNLNAGRYGVSVEAGPSYTTKRVEAAEGQIAMTQANPTMWQTHGDLIAKNMDWPGADEFAKRSRLVLPPQIQQAIQAEEEGEDPKVIAATAPLKQALEEKGQQIQAAEAGIKERDEALQKVESENHALKADREAALLKAQTDQFNAETARMKAAAEASVTPEDNSDIERLKLEYEDRWKKLEAETKVIVAQIGAQQATETANISAQQATQTAAMGAQQAQEAKATEAQPQESKTDTALAVALQGFQEALVQLRQPRKVVRGADGRVEGIQ